MKTRTWTLVALTALLGVVMAIPAEAQRGQGGLGMRARTGCAESALRLREGLELNDQQVSQLEALRTSCMERQQSHQAEALEMRSQLAAGQITVEDYRTAMEARRETASAAQDATRTRLEEILTEEQMTELTRSQARLARGVMRGMQGRGQMGMRGRGHQGFRGRGMQGFRGRQDFRGRVPPRRIREPLPENLP